MLVPCPRCDGRSVVNPFEQKEDGVCVMCAGHGEIDPDFVCDCGRPGVQEAKNGQPLCLSLECVKRLEDAQKTLPLDQALTEQDVEDGFAWGGWGGMY